MSYGFQAISSNNKIQIDNTYHNYAVYSKTVIGIAGVFTAPSISGALVFINAPSQTVFLRSLSGLTYTIGGITSSATILCMARPEQYSVVSASNYGLQVFDANNEKSFDSNYPYADVISTSNYAVLTTQTITVSTNKTLFVNLDALGLCYMYADTNTNVNTWYCFSAKIINNQITFAPVVKQTFTFGGADSFGHSYGDYRNVTIIGAN